MVGSKDSSDVSPSIIIEPTMKTLSAEDQQEFEEHKEQLIKEAQAKFLANFKVNRNHMVVRQRTTDMALFRPTTTTPKVSETNEVVTP
jgi:protease II